MSNNNINIIILLIFLFFVENIVAYSYSYNWKTVRTIKNQYERNISYDDSIIDSKINYYVQNKLIIQENKLQYNYVINEMKQILKKNENVKLDITKVVFDKDKFTFLWTVQVKLFHRIGYVDGISRYETNEDGKVITHGLNIKQTGCLEHNNHFYIHPKFKQAIKVKAN